MGIEEDPSLEIVAKESHSIVQSLMSPGVVKVSNVETVPTATPVRTYSILPFLFLYPYFVSLFINICF